MAIEISAKAGSHIENAGDETLAQKRKRVGLDGAEPKGRKAQAKNLEQRAYDGQIKKSETLKTLDEMHSLRVQAERAEQLTDISELLSHILEIDDHDFSTGMRKPSQPLPDKKALMRLSKKLAGSFARSKLLDSQNGDPWAEISDKEFLHFVKAYVAERKAEQKAEKKAKQQNSASQSQEKSKHSQSMPRARALTKEALYVPGSKAPMGAEKKSQTTRATPSRKALPTSKSEQASKSGRLSSPKSRSQQTTSHGADGSNRTLGSYTPSYRQLRGALLKFMFDFEKLNIQFNAEMIKKKHLGNEAAMGLLSMQLAVTEADQFLERNRAFINAHKSRLNLLQYSIRGSLTAALYGGKMKSYGNNYLSKEHNKALKENGDLHALFKPWVEKRLAPLEALEQKLRAKNLARKAAAVQALREKKIKVFEDKGLGCHSEKVTYLSLSEDETKTLDSAHQALIAERIPSEEIPVGSTAENIDKRLGSYEIRWDTEKETKRVEHGFLCRQSSAENPDQPEAAFKTEGNPEWGKLSPANKLMALEMMGALYRRGKPQTLNGRSGLEDQIRHTVRLLDGWTEGKILTGMENDRLLLGHGEENAIRAYAEALREESKDEGGEAAGVRVSTKDIEDALDLYRRSVRALSDIKGEAVALAWMQKQVVLLPGVTPEDLHIDVGGVDEKGLRINVDGVEEKKERGLEVYIGPEGPGGRAAGGPGGPDEKKQRERKDPPHAAGAQGGGVHVGDGAAAPQPARAGQQNGLAISKELKKDLVARIESQASRLGEFLRFAMREPKGLSDAIKRMQRPLYGFDDPKRRERVLEHLKAIDAPAADGMPSAAGEGFEALYCRVIEGALRGGHASCDPENLRGNPQLLLAALHTYHQNTGAADADKKAQTDLEAYTKLQSERDEVLGQLGLVHRLGLHSETGGKVDMQSSTTFVEEHAARIAPGGIQVGDAASRGRAIETVTQGRKKRLRDQLSQFEEGSLAFNGAMRAFARQHGRSAKKGRMGPWGLPVIQEGDGGWMKAGKTALKVGAAVTQTLFNFLKYFGIAIHALVTDPFIVIFKGLRGVYRAAARRFESDKRQIDHSLRRRGGWKDVKEHARDVFQWHRSHPGLDGHREEIDALHDAAGDEEDALRARAFKAEAQKRFEEMEQMANQDPVIVEADPFGIKFLGEDDPKNWNSQHAWHKPSGWALHARSPQSRPEGVDVDHETDPGGYHRQMQQDPANVHTASGYRVDVNGQFEESRLDFKRDKNGEMHAEAQSDDALKGQHKRCAKLAGRSVADYAFLQSIGSFWANESSSLVGPAADKAGDVNKRDSSADVLAWDDQAVNMRYHPSLQAAIAYARGDWKRAASILQRHYNLGKDMVAALLDLFAAGIMEVA